MSEKIRTIAEMLAEIIIGKAKLYTCSGFPIPGTHKLIEYDLSLGIASYVYVCPICGFGQAGSLSEEEVNALSDLRRLQSSEQKESNQS